MIASASRPAINAATISACPGRKSSKPKIDLSYLCAVIAIMPAEPSSRRDHVVFRQAPEIARHQLQPAGEAIGRAAGANERDDVRQHRRVLAEIAVADKPAGVFDADEIDVADIGEDLDVVVAEIVGVDAAEPRSLHQ